MPKPCPVIHFEMPYHDATRASVFYAEAFGWRPQPLGAEMDHYVLIETCETEAGRAVSPGEINGGLFPYKEGLPAQAPLVVISVEDIDAAAGRVTAAGGKVHGTPMAMPGVGKYVAFTDCEGNDAAMLEPEA